MPIDESNYKTMKLYRCKKCGNVYAASLSGSTECPDCASNDVSHFSPDGSEEARNDRSE
jgi:predicted Zn-ribbon and HTH transcriptional regulator